VLSYHEAGAQEQAVQRLGDVGGVNVTVVRVVVLTVAPLKRGQELRQAGNGDLQTILGTSLVTFQWPTEDQKTRAGYAFIMRVTHNE
jgi:hypothetical protein